MKRILWTFFLLVGLAASASAAVNVIVSGGVLRDAFGATLPPGSVVALVASTQDNQFTTPTPFSSLKVGDKIGGDDVVVALFPVGPQNTAVDGGILGIVTFDYAKMGIANLGAGDRLALYWFPGASLSNGAIVPNAAYGIYRADSIVNRSNTTWLAPDDSAGGTVELNFLTQAAGGGSDPAVAIAALNVGTVFSNVVLDVDPGWTRTGEWAFGHPTGGGGASNGFPDPTSGATGSNVFGINLNGDYALTVAPASYLTAGPFNFSGYTNTRLQFQSWLNTDRMPNASATIEVSLNGVTWTKIWDNGSSPTTANSWTQVLYNIGAIADNQPSVYIRWGHQVTGAGASAYSGWNIDDIELVGQASGLPGGDITSNLVAWWKFDEGAGTSAADSSGSGNNGTLSSGPTWIAGKIGSNAVNLDGVDDYVNVGTGNPMAGNVVTIAGWVNSPSYATGYLVVKGDDATNNSYGLEFYAGGIYLMTVAGGTPSWLAGGNLTTNTWHHVVGVINGSTKTLYVDGVNVASGPLTGSILNSGSSLWLGKQNRPGFTYPFAGGIDDVRIYSRALPAADVAALYAYRDTATSSPTITTQPQSQTVAAGANVTFIVVATGTPAPSYQWRKNGVAIGGATATTLSLNAVTAADAATYTVVVSNGSGNITSNGATLTVNLAGDITSNLVAWWKFDEGAGTGAADSSGSGNNGTLSSGPTWIAGKIGSNAVNLDGVDDYVDVGTGNPMAGNVVTIAGWVNSPSYATGYLVVKGDDATNNSYGLEFYAGGIYLMTVAGGTPSWLAGGNLTTNTWHHVVGVINGSTKTLYVDGVNVASGPLTGSILNSGSSLWLGKQNRPGFTYPFAGGMDDVRIYSRALPAADVAALYAYRDTATSSPTITTQPQSQTVAAGANVTFIVVATGTPAPSYQWRKNGVAIGGATATTLSLNAVTAADAATYTVVVSNGSGNITSNGATLTVNLAGDITSNLVAWWKFDEGAGTGAADSSGSGNNGTLSSGPTWIAGKIGSNAVNLDGVDDYVDVGTGNPMAGNVVTIAGWVNSPSYATGYLVVKGDDATNNSYGLEFYAGGIYLMTVAGGTPSWLAGGNLTTNTWHHVVGVINGSTKTLYVDGVNVASGPLTGSILNSGSSLWLGKQNRPGFTYPFAGGIDDVRIYSRALSAADVAALYAYRDITSNLVAWWKFDEGAGTSAADTSGSGNNGTLSSGPTWIAGKIGSNAVNLDGVDDYVDVGTGNPMAGNVVTIAGWVNSPSYATGYLVVKGDDATNNSYGLEFYAGGIYLMTVAGGTPSWLAGGNLTTNTWHHVVGVINGSTKTLYVDGVNVASGPLTGSILNSGSSLWLGKQNRPGFTYPFAGGMDDVRIYSRALPAADVAALYAYRDTATSSSTIKTQPRNQTATAGAELKFRVEATDTPASSFQKPNNGMDDRPGPLAMLSGYAMIPVYSAETAYVTGAVTGPVRNDYSGWVGMQIVVGANPLTVSQLGRLVASGNSGTHTVKLVKASDGTDVVGGSVAVATSGGTAGQFLYGHLGSPVTLTAGATYLLLSQETAGGDNWYGWNTTVTTTGVAAVSAVAWGMGPGDWNTVPVANQSYGPVDFKY